MLMFLSFYIFNKHSDTGFYGNVNHVLVIIKMIVWKFDPRLYLFVCLFLGGRGHIFQRYF